MSNAIHPATVLMKYLETFQENEKNTDNTPWSFVEKIIPRRFERAAQLYDKDVVQTKPPSEDVWQQWKTNDVYQLSDPKIESDELCIRRGMAGMLSMRPPNPASKDAYGIRRAYLFRLLRDNMRIRRKIAGMCQDIVKVLDKPLPKEFLEVKPIFVSKNNGKYRTLCMHQSAACLIFEQYLFGLIGTKYDNDPANFAIYARRQYNSGKRVVLMDIKKAFPNTKMTDLIAAQPDPVIRSYLNNKYSNTFYKDSNGAELKWRMGLIQGSVLSSQVFNAYLRHLTKGILNPYTDQLFVDDICLTECSDDHVANIRRAIEGAGYVLAEEKMFDSDKDDHMVCYMGAPLNDKHDADFLKKRFECMLKALRWGLDKIRVKESYNEEIYDLIVKIAMTEVNSSPRMTWYRKIFNTSSHREHTHKVLNELLDELPGAVAKPLDAKRFEWIKVMKAGKQDDPTNVLDVSVRKKLKVIAKENEIGEYVDDLRSSVPQLPPQLQRKILGRLLRCRATRPFFANFARGYALIQ